MWGQGNDTDYEFPPGLGNPGAWLDFSTGLPPRKGALSHVPSPGSEARDRKGDGERHVQTLQKGHQGAG